MIGRGPGETFPPATGDAGAWLTVSRVSLDALATQGPITVNYLCNVSDPAAGGGGGCSHYDSSAALVIPSDAGKSLIQKYKMQKGTYADVAVIAFASNPFAFAGTSQATYGPSVRVMFLRALDIDASGTGDLTLAVSGLSGTLIQARASNN